MKLTVFWDVTVYFGKQVPLFLRVKLLHFLTASPPLPPCNSGIH